MAYTHYSMIGAVPGRPLHNHPRKPQLEVGTSRWFLSSDARTLFIKYFSFNAILT
jgi:hypothetical protein